MGKKFKITEEQYNKLVAEDITLNADVAAANGDIKKAVETTKQEAQKNGIDINKTTIQSDFILPYWLFIVTLWYIIKVAI